MPKIRLSAIATDIKGKSNGSVFSKNSGGTYFRTNTTGGGNKSQKWTKNKNGFSSIASRWRTLTTTQQQAWRDAALLYPTVNVWGDPRTPSGYELFMRLNGVLSGNNLPINLTPSAPRSIPTPGAVVFDTPEQFQLTPVNAAFSYMENNPVPDMSYSGSGIVSLLETAKDFTISFRLKIAPFLAVANTNSDLLPVLTIGDINDPGFAVFISEVTPTQFMLHVRLYEAPAMAEVTATVLVNSTQDFNSIAVRFPSSGITSAVVIVNGTPVSSSGSNPNSLTTIVVNDSFVVFPEISSLKLAAGISDIRLFDQDLGNSNAAIVAHGYVIDSELRHWDMAEIIDDGFKNYNSSNDTAFLYPDGLEPVDFYLRSINSGLVPVVTMSYTGTLESDYILSIYSTPPISAGRGTKQSKISTLAIVDFDASGTVVLTPFIQSAYSFIPPGSQMMFGVQVVDATTGAVLNSSKPTQPTNRRFKPGAELSGKPN